MKLKKDIFAVGKWNGLDFEVQDLEDMVDSFNKLKAVHKVPLKLGHDDQNNRVGQPALGWLSDMYVDYSKQPIRLMGEFEDVPEILGQAFEKNLYRNVSIELDFKVRHKGDLYNQVVSAVAILGSELPAVNVLEDLRAFMSRAPKIEQRHYKCEKRANFSANINQSEEDTMTLEQENAELKLSLAEEKLKFERTSAELTSINTATAKQAIEAARSAVNVILDTAVTDSLITPARREAFSRTLNVSDDTAVLAIKLDDLKDMIGFENKGGTKIFAKETAISEGQPQTDEDALAEGESIDGKLLGLVQKHSSAHKVSFGDAQQAVFSRCPKLARAYTDANVKH